MSNTGTIILVEDDQDDVELIKTIIQESFAHHEFKVFKTLVGLFDWLNVPYEKPFVVICDNNWRNRNQQELKRLSDLNPQLNLTKIPFIFLTAGSKQEDINNAFADLNVQGYFDKGNNYQEMKDNLSVIINYWEKSFVPSAA